MQQGGGGRGERERGKQCHLEGPGKGRGEVCGVNTSERRDIQVTQTPGCWGKRGKMERKRDEGVKEAIIEPAPETDPNGSKEDKQGGGRG